MQSKTPIWTATMLLAAALCPALPAQSSVSAVRVFTEPAGLNFYVDGQGFYSTGSFNWPASSKHVVTSSDQDVGVGNRYVFRGWVTNISATDPIKVQPLTADPSLQWIKLVFETHYQIRVNLIDCPEAGHPCASAGRVQVDRCGVFDRAGTCYVSAASEVLVRVFPNDGFIFTGWAQVAGSVGRPAAFEFRGAVREPWNLTPQFQPAVPVEISVNIVTIPPRLRILADQTPYSPPSGAGQYVSLEWGRGTAHTIGTDRVQVENGIAYVFDSWSDGGSISHQITVPDQPGPVTYTARFVPAVFATFLTSPPGLKLSIDGGPNTPESGFAWAPGTTHRISAPITQTDAQGRRYRFDSWSNGKSAAFDHTVGTANERFTAIYQSLGQITLNTVPAGLTLNVDGSSCATPCSIERDAGTRVRVTAVAVRNLGEASRMIFHGWDDSSDASREIALAVDLRNYTASYVTQHRLSVFANPEDGASFQVTPPSPDGFHDAGTVVSIGARLALGFRFLGWSGDFSGSSSGAATILDRPQRVTLMLERVPAIVPGGIRNAAALLEAQAVAAGSLISIFGANLAPDLAIAGAGPLPQTLANVTVRVGDLFLPLVLVSPGQINAQLPAGLPQGNHTLTVRWEGRPETAAPIAVVRNAPGLFFSGRGGPPIGSFLRPNGSAVTTADAARVGDVVGVLGTGFGPYATPPPDGYVVNEAAGYSLADPVAVLAGDVELSDLSYAGRSGAGIGVDVVYFRVPLIEPETAYLPVKLRINGRESNVVLLPVTR